MQNSHELWILQYQFHSLDIERSTTSFNNVGKRFKPVNHSQRNFSEKRHRRQIVFRFNDSEPRLGARNDEVESPDPDDSVQGRPKSGLHDSEAKAHNNNQQSK